MNPPLIAAINYVKKKVSKQLKVPWISSYNCADCVDLQSNYILSGVFHLLFIFFGSLAIYHHVFNKTCFIVNVHTEENLW